MCSLQEVRARTGRVRSSTHRLDEMPSQPHCNQQSSLRYRRPAPLWIVLFAILGLLMPQQTAAANSQDDPNITIKEGDDFSVTCTVGDYTPYFEYLGRVYNVTDDSVKSVGNKTYVFHQENVPVQNVTEVVCYVFAPKKSIISTTVVTVGTLPKGGQDLSCRSHDFKDFACSFSNPGNKATTNYTIQLEQGSLKCNQSQHSMDDERVYFIVNSYSLWKPTINFVLYGNNTFTNATDVVIHRGTLNVSDIVIPAAWDFYTVTPGPDNVSAFFRPTEAVRYDRLYLPLLFEVTVTGVNGSYQASHSQKNDGQGKQNVTIDRLPFANWNYTLSMRSHVSNASDMWSPITKSNFTTLPAQPYRPPVATNNGFAVNSSDGSITLYWSPLNRSEHNAREFGYLIEGHGKENITTRNASVSLAPIAGSRYSVKIYSINSVGPSKDATKVDIKRDPDLEPLRFHVVEYRKNLTVSWERPPVNKAINYSVFWCTKGEKPNDYLESFNFAEITDPTISNYSVPLNATHVGVATYSSDGSSGIQWAPCVWNADEKVPKLNPNVKYKDRRIEVEWSLPDTFCFPIVESYVITYCAELAGDCRQHYVNDSFATNATIRQLLPYTNYNVTTKIRTFWGELGEALKIDRGRTEEGEPTAPRNVNITRVGANWATVQWDPPAESNGNIIEYKLDYYSRSSNPPPKIICLSAKECKGGEVFEGNTTQHIIADLEMYSNYTVTVTAHNRLKSSPASRPVEFETKPGITKMYQNEIGPLIQKASESSVSWNRPSKINAPSHFYVVVLEETYKMNYVTRRFTLLDGECTNCNFSPPQCTNELIEFEMRVRVVSGRVKQSKFDNDTYPNYNQFEAGAMPENYDANLCGSVGPKKEAYTPGYLRFISNHFSERGQSVLYDAEEKEYYLQSESITLEKVRCSDKNNETLLLLFVAAAVLTMTASALGGVLKLRNMMAIGVVFPIDLTKKPDAVVAQPGSLDKPPTLDLNMTMQPPAIANVQPHRARHHFEESHNVNGHTYPPPCDGYPDDCGSDERSTESTQSSAADANEYELRTQSTVSSALPDQTTSKTYTDMSVFSQRTHDDCSTSLGEHSSASDSGSSSLDRSHGESSECQSQYMPMCNQRHATPVSSYVHPDAVALLPGTPSPVQTPDEPFVVHTPAEIRSDVPNILANSYVTPSQLNQIGHMIRDSKRNELA